MIKCPKCGNVFPDNSRFCGICGTPLYGQAPPIYTQRVDDKEPFLAIIFSVILAGLGQMYCGKIARGLVILAISIIPSVFILAFMTIGGMTTYDDFMGILLSIVVVLVLYLIFWVWQIYDAYKLSLKWNEEVARNHVKPW
jgi:TM2 domain-containing membrane protein YozV